MFLSDIKNKFCAYLGDRDPSSILGFRAHMSYVIIQNFY
jgi:hypothetical protein